MTTHFLLMFVAFVAGFVDIVAGGGGIITLPALLTAGLDPVTALGTNKLQSALSESSATVHFLRRKEISFKDLWLGLVLTLFGSSAGTLLVQWVPTQNLTSVIPFLLLAALLFYLYAKKAPVDLSKDSLKADNLTRFFMIAGPSIGFYNGFFGPGTGSIWAIAISTFLFLPLHKATMFAKPLNLMGNFTALLWFALGGKVNLSIALTMGVGSLIGGALGARFVHSKNNHYIKALFIVMMILSITIAFRNAFGTYIHTHLLEYFHFWYS